jgi:hypothetical protein
MKRTLTFVGIICLFAMLFFPLRSSSRRRLEASLPGMPNPPLNTAVAAHGNTDWHIDTANEFLFGTNNSGSPTAENHAPDSWTRTHIHVGLTNTAHFYFDKALATPGDDSDSTNGIDEAMLFFYAGHGNPVLWNTLGDNGTQSKMRLGNSSNGGLRYYWQCSCDVFAHGPQHGTCPKSGESDFDYACPGQFDGSADSDSMRNVYERWGPVLRPQVRMACGASTAAYCHTDQANKIWNDFNNLSFDVSDSFIDGLDTGGVVPLCITMGGSSAAATPLYDSAFTNLPNTSGSANYYIEFLAPFIFKIPPVVLTIPQLLPIWELRPPPPPELLGGNFTPRGELILSTNEIKGRGPQVRVNGRSGAVYVLGERKLDAGANVLRDAEYVERARQIVAQLKLNEQNLFLSKGGRFVIASHPVEARPGIRQTTQFQKNVVVVFRRQIMVDGKAINVLGEGGQIKVQMNNDGTLLNLAKVWRQNARVIRQAPVKTREQALAEATRQLENQKAYRLKAFTWGYKELAGNVAQREMRIVYQFDFEPVEQRRRTEYPPRMIEVQAQQ